MFKIENSFRSALLLGAATAAAVSLTSGAIAQANVETVVVTGSRIPQVGIVSASPVTMVGQTEMKFEGTVDVGTMLNNLPSVFAGQTAGTGNGSSGTVTVDLRYLGPSRTLVLIDGKRLEPGDAEVPVPDLNQIPAAMIDHVEVLTGGASAVYGSDAVAGVVNFIMRKDFEGVEVDANMGIYQHDNSNNYLRGLQATAGDASAPKSVWTGANYDTTLILGTNTANGKGNITAYFGYERQNPVEQKSYDISACSLSNTHVGSLYNGMRCAGSLNYDTWYSLTGTGAYSYYFMQPGGNLVPFTGASNQYFNYGPYNSFLRPNTRWNGGAFAHYEVDKMLDVYASFMFTDDHNSWNAAPSALFWGSGTGTYGNITIPCSDPLMTAQFRTLFCPGGASDHTGTVETFAGRRNVEGGPRVTDFRHTAYRIVAGARGDLGDGWTYDVSAQSSTTLYQQLYLHDFSKAAVQTALDNGTLDVFTGIGGFTPTMLDAIYSHGQRTGTTDEMVVTGSVTGNLGQYGVQSPWANDGVGVSVGGEYRSESLEEITSVADYSGDLYGAGSPAFGQPKSGFHVWEAFGEVKIPIAQNKQFLQDLSLNGGFRYSEYSSAGSARAFKYGLEYQPIDDFRIRTSFQRAVRAPSVLDSFAPQNVVLGSYEDPCATATPTATEAECLLTGMTHAQYGHVIQCPASQCQYLSGGGYPYVKPELSDTRSLGIVLTPTFVPGLQATVDYYNIRVNKYIGSMAPDTILNQCMAGYATMCALVHRGVTGGFFGPNGYVVGTTINTGYAKTAGIDTQVDYQTDLNDWGLGNNGSLAFDFVGTYVDKAGRSSGTSIHRVRWPVPRCVPAARHHH